MNREASKILAKTGSASGQQPAAAQPIVFEDAALVRRFRHGDMQAFGSLVAKYQDRIFNMILRMCPNRAEAEELAQEAFLKAMQRIDQFRGRSRFYTWLFRIAANLTISHRRRAARLRFRSIDSLEELYGSQAHSLTTQLAERRYPRPETMAIAAETQRRILAALDELDEEFRIVLVLRDIEEMDYAQIAAVLDVPVGTVKSRLHRARLTVRDRLKDLLSEHEQAKQDI